MTYHTSSDDSEAEPGTGDRYGELVASMPQLPDTQIAIIATIAAHIDARMCNDRADGAGTDRAPDGGAPR